MFEDKLRFRSRLREGEPQRGCSPVLILIVVGLLLLWWTVSSPRPQGMGDIRVTVDASRIEDLMRQQTEAQKQMARQLDSIRLRLEALERKR